MSRNELQNTDRAEGKLVLDDDFPWPKFDYLKLRETLEAIVLCMGATTQQKGPSPTKPRPETTARLVISNDQETLKHLCREDESAAINPAK